MNKKRVVVGLSGGVDSAVSALLLQQSGFDVTGVFLKVYEDDNRVFSECPWQKDLDAAEQVAAHLSIPLLIWNFSKQYNETVLNYFFSELKNGRTPNPDILCNTDIKFGFFLSRVLEKKYDYLATGHYAQISCTTPRNYSLIRGIDKSKDQTYFLSQMTQRMLAHTLFPIGHLQKSEVRKIAKKYRLPNANRKDSQGICFIGDIQVENFIKKNCILKAGEIQSPEGKVLGKHHGLQLYTIGQRHGIRIGGADKPYYVVDKKNENQTLVVAQGKDNPLLFKKTASINVFHWIGQIPSIPLNCESQIRYRQKPVPTIISQQDGAFQATFVHPQRAVTPGQFCVLYQGGACLGSGSIGTN